ncbi:MAG: DUF2865 domain-containing protein [Alphaproteobacteria bacterium]
MLNSRKSRQFLARLMKSGKVCVMLAGVALLFGVMAPSYTAHAQGNGFRDDDQDFNRSRRSNRRDDNRRSQDDRRSNDSAGGHRNEDRRSQRCKDLERQLVSDWQLSNSPREALASLDQQLHDLKRVLRRAENEAEDRKCYEDMFLFGRSLKRTPACLRLDEEIETTKRDVKNLRRQREAINDRSNRRMRQNDLVAELARNGCGDNYVREDKARRRSNSFLSLWDDEEDDNYDSSYANTNPSQSNLPFASYRTMCVRLCDGYYFPISFSTLESRFKEDEVKCQEQCAAPAELFVYRNPGEEIEQMVSLKGQRYTDLATAFLNRKRYIKGCSCKAQEYSAKDIEEAMKAGGKQANAASADKSPTPPKANAGEKEPQQNNDKPAPEKSSRPNEQ